MTPADYPARIKGLLEAATEPDPGGPLGPWMARVRPAAEALRDEAPTLARAYLDLHAEVERLTRVLADRAAGGAA